MQVRLPLIIWNLGCINWWIETYDRTVQAHLSDISTDHKKYQFASANLPML